MRGPTTFPNIEATAAKLGVSRITLYRALTGQGDFHNLAARYFRLVTPRLLSKAPLPYIPAGALLRIPDEERRAALKIALGEAVTEEEGVLIFASAVAIAPWAGDASPLTPEPQKRQRRNRRSKTSSKS